MTFDDVETGLTKLDEARARAKEATDRLALGGAWLASHAPTHPQYAEAAARVEERRRELAAAMQDIGTAERETKTAEKANRIAGAAERGFGWGSMDAPPSLNCQVCGQAVNAYPRPTPGHYVHFACLERVP